MTLPSASISTHKPSWKTTPIERAVPRRTVAVKGCTFHGSHLHVTLVTAAHLFITTQRLTADPKAVGVA